MKCLQQEGSKLTLSVPNRFFLDWINANYLKALEEAARQILGEEASIRMVIVENTEAADIPVETKKMVPRIPPATLNEQFSFERFVVAPCNQLAHAAAKAVAEMPARHYNPLLIYSPVGLGKTHLLHAIGLHLTEIHKNLSVLYVQTQDFINEIISSIRRDKMIALREKYHRVDCLLVDDIHFIAGKNSTEEEFFHIFNMLHGSGKQIVLTSDRFPKDIANLAERLRSRFQWGLIADIQQPDVETRMAILEKKALEGNVVLSKDVSYFIASAIDTHIRELEGCLKRVMAYASIKNRAINLELVREAFKGVYKTGARREVKIEEVIKVVASYYNVKIADIKSARKTKNVAMARQIAMYLSRKLTKSSFPDIGKGIGGRDHSTVIYAINKIQSLIKKDVSLRNSLKELEEMIVEKL